MKRSKFFRTVSLVILAALVAGLYGFVYRRAAAPEVSIKAPATVQLAEQEDGSLELRWSAVTHATSYRVYRMGEDGVWQLLGVAGGGARSYVLPALSTADGTYAVRSCNVSVIGTTLSKYGRAAGSRA